MEGMGIGSHPGSTYGQVKIEMLCIERFEWMDSIDAGARHANGGRLYGGWWHAPATARQQSGEIDISYRKFANISETALIFLFSGCGLVWHGPLDYAPVSKTSNVGLGKALFISYLSNQWKGSGWTFPWKSPALSHSCTDFPYSYCLGIWMCQICGQTFL